MGVLRRRGLHVLWMVANAVDQVGGLELAHANSMNSREEGEAALHSIALQHVVHFLGCDRTLQFLTVQQFLLQFHDCLQKFIFSAHYMFIARNVRALLHGIWRILKNGRREI